MRKRGSLSVFIIIGIFLLLIITLGLSMWSGLIPNPIVKKTDAVTNFAQSCMENIAEEGISIMSAQGGYIEIPDRMETENAYIDSGFKIPYWYNKGRNYMPSRLLMERQLSQFIIERMPLCLDNFSMFPQFVITPAGNMSAVSTIKEKDVEVLLDYKIKVSGSDTDTYLDTYRAEIPTDFGKMYSLAAELMQAENRDSFLENYTDEMIACSDWLPYEGMSITCKPEIWHVSEMKDYVQNLVMYNLNFLMYENTDYEETGMPYYDKQYKVDFTGNNYRDYIVRTIYLPRWGMDFEVNPSKSGTTKPYEFKISKYLRTCVKVYHHKYSVEYPVLFQIQGEDGMFHFATPVIMRRNLPNRYQEVPLWPTEIDTAGNAQYCADTSKITVYGLDSAGNIIATPSIKSNRLHSLRVFARDMVTGALVAGVNVSYQCVNFLCPIGTISYPMQGGMLAGLTPILDAKFPGCSGGLVIGERPGYQLARTQASVDEETDGVQVILDMYPLKNFRYNVMVVEDHNNVINTRGLQDGEAAVITIKEPTQMYEESVYYPSEIENISMMAGDFTYEVDIQLVSDTEYLGALELNWTLFQEEIMDGRMITFYVVKKDPPYPPSSPEEYQELYDYAIDNSYKYPPLIK